MPNIRRSPVIWESLSPSTGDAVNMAEAFLAQGQRSRSSSLLADVLPPEGDESMGVPTTMPREKFRPDKGADYTESFTSQLQDELREMGETAFKKKRPIWADCMELPARQRIVFRNEFIPKRNIVQMEKEKHRRALQIYRVGHAQRVPCNSCQRGMGPFRKCVVDGDGNAFRGACVNCVFRESGHICRYHENYRKRPADYESEHQEGTTKKNTSQGASTLKRSLDASPSINGSPQLQDHPSSHRSKRRKGEAATNPAIAEPPAPREKTKLSKPSRLSLETSSLLKSDVVFRGTIFAAGQASVEQVQYILKRCNPDQRAFFHDAWLSWCLERAALNRPQPFAGIEAFLAAGWYEDLNEVIAKVCPERSAFGVGGEVVVE